jgi:transmembrane sensor
MEATKQRMRVAEKAAQWWVAMQRNPSRADRAAYVVWLRESPLHVAEILRLWHVHERLERFEGWGRIPSEDGCNPHASN